MWMMVNEVLETKKKGRLYMYIGTGYGKKAMYKTNFDFLEFWNGSEWVNDKQKLRSRAKTDELRTVHISDEWKG